MWSWLSYYLKIEEFSLIWGLKIREFSIFLNFHSSLIPQKGTIWGEVQIINTQHTFNVGGCTVSSHKLSDINKCL